jgi:hypothetical protein
VAVEASKLEHLSPKRVGMKGSHELTLARHFTTAKNAAYFIPYYTDAEDVALQFDKYAAPFFLFLVKTKVFRRTKVSRWYFLRTIHSNKGNFFFLHFQSSL